MRSKLLSQMIGAALATMAVSACSNGAPDAPPVDGEAEQTSIATSVVTTSSANSSDEAWGTFRAYYDGDTRGFGALLSGTAEIDPGQEIHPPHVHEEEEFLYVIEGEGEWTVGDQTFSASAGDMLYASAWDLHGITNTGDTVLKFVFWKASPNGLDPVPEPAE